MKFQYSSFNISQELNDGIMESLIFKLLVRNKLGRPSKNTQF